MTTKREVLLGIALAWSAPALAQTSSCAPSGTPAVVHAEACPGADWAAKVNAAMSGCPANQSCTIDASRLANAAPAATAIAISSSFKHLLLGDGEYAFSIAPGIVIKNVGSTQLNDSVAGAGEVPMDKQGTPLPASGTLITCQVSAVTQSPCVQIGSRTTEDGSSNQGYPLARSPSPDSSRIVASNAADTTSADLKAGDWLLIASMATAADGGFDLRNPQWLQVAPGYAAGDATIPVVVPPDFDFDYKYIESTTYALDSGRDAAFWRKPVGNILHPSISNLSIRYVSAPGVVNQGVAALYVRQAVGPKLVNLTLYSATKGLKVLNVYSTYKALVSNLTLVTAMSAPATPLTLGGLEMEGAVDANVSGLRVQGITTNSAIVIEYGTNHSRFNNIQATSKVSGLHVIDANDNVFTNVRLNQDPDVPPGSYGLLLTGANNNTFANISTGSGKWGYYVRSDQMTIPMWLANNVYTGHQSAINVHAVCVRPTSGSAKLFCTRQSGDQSGGTQPAWDSVASPAAKYQQPGSTIADNQITWTYAGFSSSTSGNVLCINKARSTPSSVAELKYDPGQTATIQSWVCSSGACSCQPAGG